MNNLEIKKVLFMGTELMAARDNDGQIWAGVRWMCDGIGLSEGQRKSERLKIQKDKILSKGGRNFVLPTKGGNQETLCLKLDFVPLWLAKISITPTMEQETPELADTLMQYQLRAKDVLAAAFLPGYAQEQQVYRKKATSLGEVAQFLRVIRATMKDDGQPSQEISRVVEMICTQFGIRLPSTFVKESPFEQLEFDSLKV